MSTAVTQTEKVEIDGKKLFWVEGRLNKRNRLPEVQINEPYDKLKGKGAEPEFAYGRANVCIPTEQFPEVIAALISTYNEMAGKNLIVSE